MKIITIGQSYLDAAIGSPSSVEYTRHKTDAWTKQLNKSDIVITTLQAAYTTFALGFKHRWTFLIRTVPDIVATA